MQDPMVTASGLRDVIAKTAHLKRHCRDEMYCADAEPQVAEFVLLLAAAKLLANACDQIWECVNGYRSAARRLPDYDPEIELRIAELSDEALRSIITRRAYPIRCTHKATITTREYSIASRMESDYVRYLRDLLGPASEEDEHLPRELIAS